MTDWSGCKTQPGHAGRVKGSGLGLKGNDRHYKVFGHTLECTLLCNEKGEEMQLKPAIAVVI